MVGEVATGGAVGLDRAGRADVVGRHRVAELGQHARPGDVGDRGRLLGHPVEVRRLANIGRIGIPGEGVASRGVETLPPLVTGEDVGVVLLEEVARQGRLDRRLDVLGCGPDVLEEDVVALLVLAERVGVEVEVHRPGQTVGDDQRRRREVVHLDVRVDPALEVAVARQHRGDGEVTLLHGGRDLLGQRARVADAGRAAVADEVVAELVEVGPQTCLLVVAGDDLGARSHRGLDPRLDRQPLLDSVLCEHGGGHHDRRVGRVGARRDRGDDDGAVLQAITTVLVLAATGSDRDLTQVAVDAVVLDVDPELLLGLREHDPVLRTLRAGDRRDDRGEVELELLGEARLSGWVEPHALLLGVGLDQGDLLVGAAGQVQVVQGDLVDREDRAGRAELRAHVADRRPVGQRQGGHAGAVELHELPDDALLAQHVGDRQHDIRRGHAGVHRTRQLEADDPRDEHGDGLAEHGRLGLDATDAPAENPQAVDHRGVAVCADAGVGVGHAVTHHRHVSEPLDVDLVDDAGAGRHDLEVVEGGLAPPQELVALTVALVLDLDIAPEGICATEDVDLDGVVDDQLSRGKRVDLGGIPTEVGHGLAHGGQVDDAGHAGEVLHDHAGRGELDLGVRLGVLVPLTDGVDVVSGDVRAVLSAEKVLQQHFQAVREGLVALDRVDPVDLVGLLTDCQLAVGVEAVRAGHQRLLPDLS